MIQRATNQISDSSKKVTFSQHLLEVRSRLLRFIIFFIIGSVIGYFLHASILDILVRPLNQPIFYSSPAGGFDFVFKTSIFFGFVVSLPILVYEVLGFVRPLLPQRSSWHSFFLLSFSCLLLVSGMAFAYFISLPAALHFLDGFASDEVQSLISADEYFSFVTRYLFGFGLLFQLPLVMLIINSVKRFSTRTLLRPQKWVILASFILAAVLTPTPDIFNQLLMAIPLIVLYEYTVLLIWLVNKKHARKSRPNN